MGSDLFNHFAQHFRQPSSKMKMEALMILVEHGMHRSKKEGKSIQGCGTDYKDLS